MHIIIYTLFVPKYSIIIIIIVYLFRFQCFNTDVAKSLISYAFTYFSPLFYSFILLMFTCIIPTSSPIILKNAYTVNFPKTKSKMQENILQLHSRGMF